MMSVPLHTYDPSEIIKTLHNDNGRVYVAMAHKKILFLSRFSLSLSLSLSLFLSSSLSSTPIKLQLEILIAPDNRAEEMMYCALHGLVNNVTTTNKNA
jgi:hypothetical protein